MPGIQKKISGVAVRFENKYDGLRYRLVERRGRSYPIKVLTYRGYGTAKRFYIKGRVLEDHGEIKTRPNDHFWNNLVKMFRRLATNEIPYAKVCIRFQNKEMLVAADEEGFFEGWIEPDPPFDIGSEQLWVKVDCELVEPKSLPSGKPVCTTGEVLISPRQARFVVISDIDDTIVRTNAAHFLQMLRTVMLGNARTRLPFPGVAAFLRALHEGENGQRYNPLLYVSSSPWNIYDLLSEFFALNQIPIGPVLFLRDWGLTADELFPVKNRGYKLQTIRHIIDFYNGLPFILIGDSGQEDPEIYADLANKYPDRILAVYIRNVSRDLVRPEAIRRLAEKLIQAGSALILADDTLQLAQHAAQQGWINPTSLQEIRGEKRADETPPKPLETIIGK